MPSRFCFVNGIIPYNFTNTGSITCADIINATHILEKYYRHNHWVGNRIAAALHNFLNALFTRESTIAFVALVSVIEIFTNLSRNKDDPVLEQIYKNTPKLVPTDGHGEVVTRERLENIYDARSELAHGSYGRGGHRLVNLHTTHIDAKFSNVDVRLSASAMSIAVKLLHRVLFDSEIRLLVENAKSSTQERRGLRRYLDAIAIQGG